MADAAKLLSSTEDEIKNFEAQIQQFWQEADEAQQKFVNATKAKEAKFKAVWDVALRREEAARISHRAVMERKDALIKEIAGHSERSGESETDFPSSHTVTL